MTLRIAVTPGEPAGIGPDLIAILAQHGSSHEIVVIADPQLIQQRAARLGLPVKIRPFDPRQSPKPMDFGQVCVAPVTLAVPCSAGELNSLNAAYVLQTLDTAIDYCQQGITDALVTGPIHKGIINQARLGDKPGDPAAFFSGHTEYLAQQTHTDHVVMMLATKGLRVALATTHIPLAAVPAAITPASLIATIRVLHQALRRDFGISKPRLLVCGLNPHAGEGGHMGREEVDVIEPVLNQLRQEDMTLIGPLPADSLFTPKILEQGDAVLAMYHDQGLPVLKYKGFGRAVNITLGLPIIRTSVDHGTALDIAGSGKADTGSLETALQWAIDMAHTRIKNSLEKNGIAKRLNGFS